MHHGSANRASERALILDFGPYDSAGCMGDPQIYKKKKTPYLSFSTKQYVMERSAAMRDDLRGL